MPPMRARSRALEEEERKMNPVRTHVRSGRALRRVLVFATTATAGALVVLSVAFACTPPGNAQTYWSDGTTTNKSLAAGTRVSAYATLAIEGVPYKLRVGSTPANHQAQGHTCMNVAGTINDTNVYANSFGTIAMTTGTIPSVAAGSYEVCFRDPSSSNGYSSRPALLTVV